MISVFQKKEDCCGCTACQHTCPTKAIKMVTDSEGFKYPEIDQELCTDCGECRKVCVFQNDYNTSQGPEFPKVYAVKHVDVNVRMTSTSGGAFTALSDYILDKNGVVYGAAFDEEMNVVHKMASSKIKRDQFKGSKYVQSDLGNTYKEIEKLLKNRKIVLFTGTPCQTAGLNSYLNGIDKQNLFLCDLVCHGTPSPLMWKEHIKYLENKEKSKIVEYYCRSKVVSVKESGTWCV